MYTQYTILYRLPLEQRKPVDCGVCAGIDTRNDNYLVYNILLSI